MTNISLLDCTLRDGAYINDSCFGNNTLKGIINNLALSNIEIIEVGWLKDSEYKEGSSYFHKVEDIEKYLPQNSLKNNKTRFVAMIDYGRYDINNLSNYNGNSINSIRVVFPKEKFKEAIEFSKIIKEKGYELCLQAANTQSYSDYELIELVEKVNEVMPESISIVDTFGVMYFEDLNRIFMIMDNNLNRKIKLGFHSHNNLQMSFALSMQLCELSRATKRDVIIDCSLAGMGRGAGNTCTELISNYLNLKYDKNYDYNLIMDTIDIYMQNIINNYKWGYSIPFCIAGQLGSHVNNIAYLQNTHKTNYRDMKVILSSMPKNERKLYNYDNLEKKYLEYVNNEIDDVETLNNLKQLFKDKDILIVAPGKSAQDEIVKVKNFINEKNVIVVGVNSIIEGYKYDYLFFSNKVRYNYAINSNDSTVSSARTILTSNVKTKNSPNEYIINFNTLMRLGWKYFDNSTIMALRLFSKVQAKSLTFVGFDGYDVNNKTSYSDQILQSNLSNEEKVMLNKDIEGMLEDFVRRDKGNLKIHFLTKSRFENSIKDLYVSI